MSFAPDDSEGPGSGPGRHSGGALAVCLALVMLGATLASGAEGTLRRSTWVDLTGHEDLPMVVVPLTPRRTLDPVTSGELMGGPQELSIAMPAGGTGRTTVLAPTISRRIPELWQVRLSGESTGGDLQVTYELISESGRTGCLSLAEEPSRQLNARLQPIAPVSRHTAGDRVLISGGVDLVIDALEVHVAGEYRGTIQITINQL